MVTPPFTFFIHVTSYDRQRTPEKIISVLLRSLYWSTLSVYWVQVRSSFSLTVLTLLNYDNLTLSYSKSLTISTFLVFPVDQITKSLSFLVIPVGPLK